MDLQWICKRRLGYKQVVAVSSPSLSLSLLTKAKQVKWKKKCKKFGFPPHLDWTKPRPTPHTPPSLPRIFIDPPPSFHPTPSSLSHHALVQVLDADDWPPGLAPSSVHLSRLRRRAFMKKLLTVVSSRPNCCEMVSCISLDGRLFSLKIASRVRRCRSVKTNRDFFGVLLRSFAVSCSFRLHAVRREGRMTAGWESGGGVVRRQRRKKALVLFVHYEEPVNIGGGFGSVS